MFRGLFKKEFRYFSIEFHEITIAHNLKNLLTRNIHLLIENINLQGVSIPKLNNVEVAIEKKPVSSDKNPVKNL